MHKNYFALLLGLFLSHSLLLAQGGALDPTFNGSGIIETQVQGVQTGFQRVRLQPDGKVLAFAFMYDDTHIQSAVLRYNPDGSTDQSFGDNGAYITENAWPYYEATDGLLLSDGKIIEVSNVVYENSIALTQLLPSGALDSSFSNNGVSFIDFDISLYAPYPNTAFLQPDGKIIILGNYFDFTTDIARGFAIRVLPNGDLDDTFGIEGFQTFVPVNPDWKAEIYGGKAQPDGKILVSGRMGKDGDVNSQVWYIARLLADGTFDSSFDGDGVINPNIGSLFSEAAFELHLLSDGKILAAGYGQKLPGQHFTILRFNTNGTPDVTFGLGGKAQVDFGCCHSYIFDIAEQTDGKLVVAGLSDADNIHTRFSVARVKPNGFLDLGFGDQGKVLILFNHDSISARANTIALQPDGKILISGLTTNEIDNELISGILVRLNSGNIVGTSLIDPEHNLQLEVSPNPFSGTSLQVAYTLQEASTISMSIYDQAGRKVLDLVSLEQRQEGLNEEVFKLPTTLPVGEYYVNLETRTGRQLVKIIKAK